MADVLDSAVEERTALLVLLALADAADADGTNCFPGTRRIARQARASERTVTRTIQELEREGLLWVIQQGLGSGNRTEYRLNVRRIHDEAEAAREADRARKRRHGDTFRKSGRKVTWATGKGDTGARKGDNGDRPLDVLPGITQKPDPPPPVSPSLPRGSERDAELTRAVDQVTSALGLGRRKRRMVQEQLALAAEKGEPAAASALAMIVAVRDQDALHLEGKLKYKYGLQKFVGEGLWRQRDRWGWDVKEMRLQAEARVGSVG